MTIQTKDHLSTPNRDIVLKLAKSPPTGKQLLPPPKGEVSNNNLKHNTPHQQREETDPASDDPM